MLFTSLYVMATTNDFLNWNLLYICHLNMLKLLRYVDYFVLFLEFGNATNYL